MGRKVAVLWHASFSIGAGVLYFYFVLPRWPELMGDTGHSLGTGPDCHGRVGRSGRTAGGIHFAAHPQAGAGTLQLALSMRIWSIMAHVLAGALIVGTAISEVWLSLDAAGQWLFGIYGAAAAIAVLGFFGFYLSFVAELPPPPPKPLKPKKPKQRRLRRKKTAKGDEAEPEAAEEAENTELAAQEDEEAVEAPRKA